MAAGSDNGAFRIIYGDSIWVSEFIIASWACKLTAYLTVWCLAPPLLVWTVGWSRREQSQEVRGSTWARVASSPPVRSHLPWTQIYSALGVHKQQLEPPGGLHPRPHLIQVRWLANPKPLRSGSFLDLSFEIDLIIHSNRACLSDIITKTNPHCVPL